ncbi:MAG TPA: poly-gamma-glutamate synthase PgsB [bacterium]|nr:poly-gamma-glutamate synthase PgsB [bacterium]
MTSFSLLAVITSVLLVLAIVERIIHVHRLGKIPVRIHVSGTRGKSSVTRLLAAALRYAGKKTAAKTTGTLARMILPDGGEVPVYRPAGANIIEQKRIVNTAYQMGCEALIVECMALQPILHWISESKLVQATHGVITNARADHLDVMGPEEIDVAKALAGMIPVKGKLFTAERKNLEVLAAAAKDRKSSLHAVSEEDLAAVTPADLAGFSYTEHAENVALALKVLLDLGLTREQAIAGMWQAKPDPGALTENVINFFGRRIIFVNGFAANDPESTEKIWNLAHKKYSGTDRTVAVFNMRADRPSRTVQMAKDTTFWHQAERVVLIGTGAYLFARMAGKTDFDVSRFIFADQVGVEEIFESILEACGRNSLVVGMGNIGGPGLPLVRFFRNRALPEEQQ